MKRWILFVLSACVLLSALFLPLSAVTLPQDKGAATVVSAIADSVGKDTAGAAVVLLTKEGSAMTEGFGYAHIEGRQLVTPETVFVIGRLSSLLVALTAYRLAELGQISLTESIATYLPEAFVRQLAFSYPVTVEQLLLGNAGLEGRSLELRYDKAEYCFESLEEALLAQVPRQIASPGEFYAYSGFGIALAAFVLEQATQTPYEALAAQYLLEPLGMSDTVIRPTAATAPVDVAAGHELRGEGQFSVAPANGRSYAVLYPADGALSSARDVARVLQLLLKGEPSVLSEASRAQLLGTHFKKGVFHMSAPALSASGDALGQDARTSYFGASLWLNAKAGVAVAVLTNTPGNSLLTLPATLCGGDAAITVKAEETLPAVDAFTGSFVAADSESKTLVGRLTRYKNTHTVTENGDGTLSFQGVQLRQIAAGVFVNAARPEDGVAVQILLDAEGEVEQLITADGVCYLPVGALEQAAVAEILFWALLLSSVLLIAVAVLSLWRYAADRGRRRPRGFIYSLPPVLGAVLALCTLLQLLVAFELGSAAFASFFTAMGVIDMLLVVAAVAAIVAAFVGALTRRGMTRRVIRFAILLLLYVFLLSHWAFIPL